MAIGGGTSLGGLGSTSNATSFTSVGPNNPSGAANTLLIASVVVTGGSGEEPPTVAGHGVSWSIVQSTLHGTTVRFITYQANGSGATSTKFTVSGYGTARTGCCMEVNEYTGIKTDTIGVGAGSSVVQVATVASGTGTSGSSNALASYSHSANRPYATTEHLANEITNVDTSPATWASGGNRNYNTPPTSIVTAHNLTDQETTFTATWTTSAEWRARILELNGDAGTNATASPDATSRSFVIDQVSPSAAAAPSISALDRSFTAPAAEARASSSITPATVARSITVPQAGDRAGSTLTPSTVTRSFALDQVTVTGGTGIEVGQAPETDEAQPLRTPVRIGQAFEVDEAIRFSAMALVGFASEVDLAQSVDLFKGQAGTGIVRSPNRVRIYATHNEVT